MIRLYIDIEALQEEEGVEMKDLDIVSFKIYEGSSSGGTFTLIDTVTYNPQVTYIETDEEESDTHWFKVSYVNSSGSESELSQAILGEDVYSIIGTVALVLGDINREDEANMAFTDSEYVLKIKEALKQHRGTSSLSGVEEADLSSIILLVRISCCYDLAYDNAKNSKITLPDGISLSKGDRVNHYLNIAKQLEAWYEKKTTGLKDEDGQLEGTPYVEVTTFQRRQYFGGGRFKAPSQFNSYLRRSGS